MRFVVLPDQCVVQEWCNDELIKKIRVLRVNKTTRTIWDGVCTIVVPAKDARRVFTWFEHVALPILVKVENKQNVSSISTENMMSSRRTRSSISRTTSLKQRKKPSSDASSSSVPEACAVYFIQNDKDITTVWPCFLPADDMPLIYLASLTSVCCDSRGKEFLCKTLRKKYGPEGVIRSRYRWLLPWKALMRDLSKSTFTNPQIWTVLFNEDDIQKESDDDVVHEEERKRRLGFVAALLRGSSESVPLDTFLRRLRDGKETTLRRSVVDNIDVTNVLTHVVDKCNGSQSLEAALGRLWAFIRRNRTTLADVLQAALDKSRRLARESEQAREKRKREQSEAWMKSHGLVKGETLRKTSVASSRRLDSAEKSKEDTHESTPSPPRSLPPPSISKGLTNKMRRLLEMPEVDLPSDDRTTRVLTSVLFEEVSKMTKGTSPSQTSISLWSRGMHVFRSRCSVLDHSVRWWMCIFCGQGHDSIVPCTKEFVRCKHCPLTWHKRCTTSSTRLCPACDNNTAIVRSTLFDNVERRAEWFDPTFRPCVIRSDTNAGGEEASDGQKSSTFLHMSKDVDITSEEVEMVKDAFEAREKQFADNGWGEFSLVTMMKNTNELLSKARRSKRRSLMCSRILLNLRILMSRFGVFRLVEKPYANVLHRAASTVSHFRSLNVQMLIWCDAFENAPNTYTVDDMKRTISRLGAYSSPMKSGEIALTERRELTLSKIRSKRVLISPGVSSSSLKTWAWTCPQCTFTNKIYNDEELQSARLKCDVCGLVSSKMKRNVGIASESERPNQFVDLSHGMERFPVRCYAKGKMFEDLCRQFEAYVAHPVMSSCVRVDWDANGGPNVCVKAVSSKRSRVDKFCCASNGSHENKSHECNRFCDCAHDLKFLSKCPLRPSQSTLNVSVEVFWTGHRRGWGVRALQFIERGTFLFVYAGEIIPYQCKCFHECHAGEHCVHLHTCERCNARGRETQSYIWDLRSRKKSRTRYVIDGRRYRNVAPFVNHACTNVNVSARYIWSDHLDPHLPTVAFFAKRDICANEELLVHYGNKIANCACSSCSAHNSTLK